MRKQSVHHPESHACTHLCILHWYCVISMQLMLILCLFSLAEAREISTTRCNRTNTEERQIPPFVCGRCVEMPLCKCTCDTIILHPPQCVCIKSCHHNAFISTESEWKGVLASYMRPHCFQEKAPGARNNWFTPESLGNEPGILSAPHHPQHCPLRCGKEHIPPDLAPPDEKDMSEQKKTKGTGCIFFFFLRTGNGGHNIHVKKKREPAVPKWPIWLCMCVWMSNSRHLKNQYYVFFMYNP